MSKTKFETAGTKVTELVERYLQELQVRNGLTKVKPQNVSDRAVTEAGASRRETRILATVSKRSRVDMETTVTILVKMKTKNIFVITPGYNEEKHIFDVVSRVKKQGFGNVIFVDDGSLDKSSAQAEKAGAIVLRHIVNMGKGAAAKTGCDYALKNNADILVLIDSDGQHKPEDIKKFIKNIENNDIVFGYRTLNSRMPYVLRFGNWYINTSSQIINGIKLKDTQSGFRCMTSETYKKVRWRSNNYTMESEMISNVAKHKLKYTEIPIETIYLDNFKGTTIIDGVKIFINMLKFKIRGS